MDQLQVFAEQIRSEINKYSRQITRFSPQLQLTQPQSRIDLDRANAVILTRFTQKYPVRLKQLLDSAAFSVAEKQTQRWLKKADKFRRRYQTELVNYCDFRIILNSPSLQPNLNSAFIPLILSDVKLTSATQLSIASPKRLNPLIIRLIYQQNPHTPLITELSEQIAQGNYTRSALAQKLRTVFPQLEVHDAKFLACIGNPKEVNFQRIIAGDTDQIERNPWVFSPIVAGLLNNQKAIDYIRQQFSAPVEPDLVNPAVPDRYLTVFQHLQARHSFSLHFSDPEKSPQLNYEITDLINLIAQHLTKASASKSNSVTAENSEAKNTPVTEGNSANSNKSATESNSATEKNLSAGNLPVTIDNSVTKNNSANGTHSASGETSVTDANSAPESNSAAGENSVTEKSSADDLGRTPEDSNSRARILVVQNPGTASAAPSAAPVFGPGISQANNPDALDQAQNIVRDYSFELHRKIPGYNISLFEIIAQIIANDVDWKIDAPAPDTAMPPKPKINPDRLFEIFQNRDSIIQSLNRLEENRHFTVQTLNNPWLFAPIETDQQAEAIKAQITRLNTELLPALKEMAANLQTSFPQFEFKSMASLSDILAQIVKLVEIYDIFVPEILDLTLAPYLEATSAKPPKKLSFFERRALIKEIRGYIRQGVLVDKMDTLHAKLETLDQFIRSTPETTAPFKDLLPDNLRQIVATFDQSSTILASLETLLPHIIIDASAPTPVDLEEQPAPPSSPTKTSSWLEAPIDDLTHVLTALQTQADDVLQSVDQRRQDLKTLSLVQPLIDYYYQLIFNRNQDLPVGFPTAEFNLALFSGLYQFAIQTLGQLRKIPVEQFTQAIQNCTQNRFNTPDLSVTFTNLNSPSFNQVFNPPGNPTGNPPFDLVIFDRLKIHSAVELFPYLALAKQFLNLETKATKLGNVLPTLELGPNSSPQLIPAHQPSPFAQAITYFLPPDNFNAEILVLTTAPSVDSTDDINDTSSSRSPLTELVRIEHRKTRQTVVLQLENGPIDSQNWERIFVRYPQILARLGLDVRYYSILEFFIQPQRLIDWFEL